MPFSTHRTRGPFPSEVARSIFLMRRRLNCSTFEFSRLVGFSVAHSERHPHPTSSERLIALLRVATTEDERRPLLEALAQRNVHPSDLAPELQGASEQPRV